MKPNKKPLQDATYGIWSHRPWHCSQDMPNILLFKQQILTWFSINLFLFIILHSTALPTNFTAVELHSDFSRACLWSCKLSNSSGERIRKGSIIFRKLKAPLKKNKTRVTWHRYKIIIMAKLARAQLEISHLFVIFVSFARLLCKIYLQWVPS